MISIISVKSSGYEVRDRSEGEPSLVSANDTGHLHFTNLVKLPV